MNTAWKVIAAAAVLALVFVVIKYINLDGDSGKEITKKTTIKSGRIQKIVRGTGLLKSSERAVIVSKVKGTIEEITVKEGQDVQKDQVLARLKNDEIDNDIKEQEGAVEKLKKRLDELKKDEEEDMTEVMAARVTWERAKSEYKTKKKEYDSGKSHMGENDEYPPNYSQEQWEKLKKEVEIREKEMELARRKYEDAKPTEAEIREAEGKYDNATHELSKLKEMAEGREMTSPLKGTVLKVFIDEETLKNDPKKEYEPGTQFFLVADLTTMEVQGTLFESDIDKIMEEQRVKVFLKPHAKTYENARITWISSIGKAGTDQGRWDIKIGFHQPPKDVKEGIRVNFEIIVYSSEKQYPRLPVEFVQKEKNRNRHFVIVRKNGRDTKREVTLGASDDHYYEVRKGLKEGEDVILKMTAND